MSTNFTRESAEHYINLLSKNSPEAEALLRLTLGRKMKPVLRLQTPKDTADFLSKLSRIAKWIHTSLEMDSPWLHDLTDRGTPVKASNGFDKAHAEANKYFYGHKRTPSRGTPLRGEQKYGYELVYTRNVDKFLNKLPLSPENMAKILSFNIKDKLSITFDAAAENFDFRILGENSNTSTKWSQHPSRSLASFNGWNGKKITKQLMANRLALYSVTQCDHVESLFGAVGAYAFARYGFLPSTSGWDGIRFKLLEKLSTQCAAHNISNIVQKKFRHILLSDKPTSLWDLVDTIECDRDGKSFAFRLIHDAKIMWNGFFDLKNPEQMNRARKYIGAEKFDAAFANAERLVSEQAMQLSSGTPGFAPPSPV